MMNINEIKRILPHRYPFLLVDAIDEIENEKRIVGRKNVTYNEPHFAGHFHDEPVMPGVLIIEAMAQVGGILVLAKSEFEGKKVYLGEIQKAKFRRKVEPGDVLKIEVEILKLRGNIGKCIGVVTVNEQLCAESEFSFSVQ